MSTGVNSNQARGSASRDAKKSGGLKAGETSKLREKNSNNFTKHHTKIDQNVPKSSPTNKLITCSSDTNAVIVQSANKKVNPCDRLSSMLGGNTAQAESQKPILRVNLIKKSNRLPGTKLLTSADRRFQIVQKDSSKNNTQKLNHSQPDTDSISIDHKNISNQVEGRKRMIDQESSGQVPKSHECKISDNTSHEYNEAKKSQRLVVSLIKDIGRTVSKEDLDEMLKEIHSAIGEIQQKQSSLNTEILKSGKKGQVKNSKKKQQQGQAIRLNVNVVPNSSDDSNISESREVSNYDDSRSLEIGGNHSASSGRKNSKGSSEKLKKVIKSHNEENSNDIRNQSPRRQFIEISSDEEKALDRKPNSSRLPDRCLRITSSHAKYISPHRKRSLEDRLNRAQEAREKFLEYRANKFRDILRKVEEMRAWREEDTLNLKTSVQTKLQKAAAKRKEQLDKIIRKAHDEDSKVSEIQFINNLEAQNKRHDMNSRKKEFEARLQDLQDERQRRFEEKQAKEVAAEERRKTLEAERKAKLLEIQQRRKLKNQKVEQQQQVKEKKRIEKNRNREQKITAIKEAYQAGVQTLKKRINQKQEQSERRHEVNLRLIRQKAFELSIKRYNSFISESNANLLNANTLDSNSNNSNTNSKQKENCANDTKRLQLKPFNTKKFCNLCKETISSELALFSHLRSEAHHSSINDHYGNTMLTTNEAVEIHNLRHIVETDEPIDSEKGTNSDDQQSSRASSLVNYYHSSYLSQANGGICISENDRYSLLAIEKRCRKLRHKLIVAGRPFNREWFANKVRSRLAQLLIQQRAARNQTTNTEVTSLANTIDLSANNIICQQNKPFYLKINRITRELISVTTDQRISGGGLMPAGIIHSVDRLLADLNKQLSCRKAPQLSTQLLYPNKSGSGEKQQSELDAEQLAMASKMIEFYAIDTLYLYDIVSCLVSTLRRIVPNVSLTSKLPSTVASHYSALVDPISLNSYYCHRSPILPARIYIKMIGLLQSLCNNHSDLCYIIFQSNNIINLSDILSYRLGFIIGNESPASSISGSSSAATLSAQTIERKHMKQQNRVAPPASSPSSFVVAQKMRESSNLRSSGRASKVSGDDCCKNGRIGWSGKTNAGAKRGEQSQQEDGADDDEEEDGDNDDGGCEDNEGDLWERAETYKRTEEIVDDMTAGLCKLLATVTETILSRPLVLLNQLDKMAFDQRSDDFISYMVSVGIVDTESVIMSHIHQQQQQQQTSSTGNNISGSNTTSAQTAATLQLSSDKSNIHQDISQTQTTSSSLQTATPAFTSSGVAVVGAGGSGIANAANAITVLPSSSMSASNKIINFTTSCIQFVTSLVKLVTAKLPDHEADSMVAQQDSTQLLATLKMTQLSGVLTLVYDMLVHSFNSLAGLPVAQQAQQDALVDQDRLSRQLGLALHALRLVNYVAYIDIQLLQETLSEDEMLPLQMRHVCSYLISYLINSSAVAGPLSSASLGASEEGQQQQLSAESLRSELINEIILLLGNFAYLNPVNQLWLKSGRRPTIIEQLIGLPFDYFSRASLKLVLMPTLISCAYLNEQICALVCQELSLSMLTSFIEDQLLSAQTEQQTGSGCERRQLNSLVADELTSTRLASNRWKFERRFAKSKWLSAKKYFEAQQGRQTATALAGS